MHGSAPHPSPMTHGECKLCQPPIFNRQCEVGWNTKQNQMKNASFTFQILKVLLIKSCIQDIATSSFIFFSFTSVDTTNFSELYSKLSKKKIFTMNFPFLTESPKPLPPP